MHDRFHVIEKASPGTCSWLLQHRSYRDWLDQGSNLLCVKGKPGAGKSTLMKFAITQTSGQNSVLAAYFFHGRGTALQKTCDGLYRSLLHQLLIRIPSLRSDFQRTYREKKQAYEQWKWNINEMQDLLTANIEKAIKLTSVIIYIDALDESGLEEVKLVSYLQDLAAKRSVKICFSCRHYPYFKMTNCPEILVERENGKDIIEYIDTVFEAQSWNVAEGSNIEVIKKIKEDIKIRSANSFQWVFLVLQIIDRLKRNAKTWKTVQKQIQKVPQGLNELYTHILSNLEEEDRVQTSTLLRWVYFAKRPLSPNELRIAMAFDTDEPPSSFESWRESDDFYEDGEEFKKRIIILSGGLVEIVKRVNAFENYDEDDNEDVMTDHSLFNSFMNQSKIIL